MILRISWDLLLVIAEKQKPFKGQLAPSKVPKRTCDLTFFAVRLGGVVCGGQRRGFLNQKAS